MAIVDDRNNAKVGDRVRVTYEGPVTDKNGYTIWLSGVAVNTYNSLAKVEVIEKAKPVLKVGDVIDGVEAFDTLPVGVVVAADSGQINVANADRVVVKTKGGFFTPLDGQSRSRSTFCEPRKIVFLP